MAADAASAAAPPAPGAAPRRRSRSEAAPTTAARAIAAPATGADRRPPPRGLAVRRLRAPATRWAAAESFFDPGWLAAGDAAADSRFVLRQARRVGAGAGQRAGARLPHLRRGARRHRRGPGGGAGRGQPARRAQHRVAGAGLGASTRCRPSRCGCCRASARWRSRSRRPGSGGASGWRRSASTCWRSRCCTLLAIGSTFNFAALLVLPVLMAGVLTLAPAGAGHGGRRGADAAGGGLAHGAGRRPTAPR